MNDFETQLAQVPLRSVPREWRGDILRAARAAAATPTPWWHSLVRLPKLALATSWVVIGILHFSMPDDPARGETASGGPVSLAMWQAHHCLTTELLTEASESAPPAPAALSTGPHGAMILREHRRFA